MKFILLFFVFATFFLIGFSYFWGSKVVELQGSLAECDTRPVAQPSPEPPPPPAVEERLELSREDLGTLVAYLELQVRRRPRRFRARGYVALVHTVTSKDGTATHTIRAERDPSLIRVSSLIGESAVHYVIATDGGITIIAGTVDDVLDDLDRIVPLARRALSSRKRPSRWFTGRIKAGICRPFPMVSATRRTRSLARAASRPFRQA